MKTTTLIAAGALMALAGVAASQAVKGGTHGARSAAPEGRHYESFESFGSLESLESLGSLASLESLKSLESLADMRSLGSLRSLRSLGSIASAGSFASLESLGSAFAGLGSFSGLASLASIGEIGGAVHHYDDAPTTMRAMPRAPWAPSDPADSLYRIARDELNQGNYRHAAALFRQIAERYPKSAYASEAMYYHAYSLYRSGRGDDLTSALSVLNALGRQYPSSGHRGDASSLRTRICGELARRGDEGCAAEISRVADPERAELRERPERPEQPERPERRERAEGGSRSGPCPTSDDDNDDRIAALNALLQMDSERAIPILEKVLARRDECSAQLRKKAVFLLSQKRGADVADALMRVVRTDPDREVRKDAVFWLGQTGSPRAVELLEEILKSSTDEDTKDKALFALSQHSSSKAAQVLRDFAARDGEQEHLREQAIFWLGQRNGDENGAFLKGLFGRVHDESLKDKIIFSLSQHHGNASWIMEIATDSKESIEIRKKALFWAGQNGASIAELTGLWSRMSDHDMREQLIFVYSQRHEREAVDKLMDIAKTEKDRELRKKAIFWLSQSHDPRVAKFLEDLIG